MVISMVTAVNDFEDGSYHAIADGIFQLGTFISQVGLAMEDCPAISDADVNTLTEMGEAFLHPLHLVMDAENNVIVNGVEIFKDVKTALTDMHDAKYEKAGKEWGDVAALVLWGKANMVSQPFLQWTIDFTFAKLQPVIKKLDHAKIRYLYIARIK